MSLTMPIPKRVQSTTSRSEDHAIVPLEHPVASRRPACYVQAHLLDVRIEGAQDGVVLEQVRGLLHTTRVVNHYYLKVGTWTANLAAKEVASNTAKAVDRNTELLGMSLRRRKYINHAQLGCQKQRAQALNRSQRDPAG